MRISLMIALVSILGIACTAAAQTASQPKQDSMRQCPMHQSHADLEHQAVVEKHGDEVMGFPHDKTTHHFLLAATGGIVEISANDAADKTNIDAIRSHLSHIAEMFAQGDFSTPMFIHDGVPPGTTTMKLLKDKIQYQYDPISSGGKVRIESSDPVAIAAIHDFLRFQITEHRTGDALALDQTGQ